MVYMQLRNQLMWRWFGIIVGGIILLISGKNYDARWPLIVILLMVAVFNTIVAALIRMRFAPLACRNIGIVGDILAISLAIVRTNGVESSFFALYALAILQQPLIMSFGELVSMTSLASLAYLTALLIKGDFQGALTSPDFLSTVMFRICFFFLTALIAERALKRTLSEYLRSEAIIESAAEGILVVDRDRRIQKVNPAGSRLLDRSEIEILGMPCQEVLRGDFCQEGCPLLIAMEKMGAISHVEETIRASEKRVFPARLSCSALLDAEGKVVGASLAYQDASEAKAHEDRRKDFVASVAHELKSPISSMASLAAMLAQGKGESEEASREYARVIHKESRRVLGMVDRLRSLSKLEREDVVVTLEKVDLVDIAKAAMNLVQVDAEARGVTISLLPGVAHVQAMSDRDLVLQVLVDLLENAVRYSSPGRRVTLRIGGGEQGPELEVKDEGMGISEKDLPFIFEKFYRGDEAKDKDPSGSGLGLALVKKMCDLMGARVSVTSIAGEGASFVVTLKAPAGGREWALAG